MEKTGRSPKPGAAAELQFLKKRADFLAAQAGERFGTASFLLIRGPFPNGLRAPRIGVTVTRKVGKAVFRNRIRRRLKAAAASLFAEIAPPPYDFVFIARPTAAARPFALLLDDMKRALLRLAALPK